MPDLTPPKRPRCKVCHGRGYITCDCWPGDCICGYGDETCEECEGTGVILPLAAPVDTVAEAAVQAAYARGLEAAVYIAETIRASEGILHKPTQSLLASAIRISATKARALAQEKPHE